VTRRNRSFSRRGLRSAGAGALCLALAGGWIASCGDPPGLGTERLTPGAIRHVFMIVLENKNFDDTFGPDSKAPYLAKTLTELGQLLTEYHATGHLSLDNYISMVSGQGPNVQTQTDCMIYSDFIGLPVLDPNGQAIGQGCVYPPIVKTVADQLEEKSFTWRGYMEDMKTPCRHPPLNALDDTQAAEAGDQYAARHNPFVYFHSIIDDQARCDANVVPLHRLEDDLSDADTTPNYVFITPDLCSDAHDTPCIDGRPGGLVSANQFLLTWVPRILSSPAFEDGLLIVTFDEAEIEGDNRDASACCNQPVGPNSPLPGIFGPGGGRIGAVLISPFVKPGTKNDTPYNHYSLLRSVEDLFGLDHLGFAGQAGLRPFGDDVFAGG
jgi:hypothetical protein